MWNLCKKALALVLALMLAAALAMTASAKQSGGLDGKKFFQTGDYEICYQVVPAQGKQVGRIFFLHGMVSSTVYWEELAGLFSRAGYLCAMMDFPGFGYSTRESKDVTPKAREEIAAELMEKLAPGKAWIVAGHSMGGGVALNLALTYPEKVSALLLYAAAAGGGGGPSGGMPDLDPELLGCLMTPLLRPLLYMDPVVHLLAAAANADFCYGMQYDIGKIVDPLKLPGTVKSLFYMTQRSTSTDLEAAAKLKIPILLLWAQNDYIVSGSMADSLTAALPNARAQTMQGGHMFTEQFSQEAFERSLAFLRGEG